MSGAATNYIDGAQIALYAFWLFFAGLVFYLRREDKREGYPLLSDCSGLIRVQGFPAMPTPKTFVLPHGGTRLAPRPRDPQPPLNAAPAAPWPGAPLQALGNPMIDGVGAASYALRPDEPELTFDDEKPKLVPLRAAHGFYLDTKDPDPRGMTVIGGDGEVAGTVTEAWVDRTETMVRYLEVELPGGGRTVLVPVPFTRIKGKLRQVQVRSILSHQFADIPGFANPDVVTMREEDRIVGYFGGGQLYAEPSRSEPLV